MAASTQIRAWVVLFMLVICHLNGGCSESTACGDFPLHPPVRECMVDTVHSMVTTYYPFADTKSIDLEVFSQELYSLLAYHHWDDETFVRELAVTINTLMDGHTRIERRFLGLSAERGKVFVKDDIPMDVPLSSAVFHNQPHIKRFDSIGYLDVSTFSYLDDLDIIDRRLNQLMDTDGLIIDLRDNGGGFPSVTNGLFGRLINRPVAAFNMIGSDGVINRTIGPVPRGKTYTKPVVVLTNPRTFSAANYFAQLIDYHERGVLIGQTSGGGGASPDMGVMLVRGVWFQVSTYVIYTPRGEHAEEGIEPHIWVTQPDDENLASLTTQTGHPATDITLRRAIEYLQGGQ